MIYRMVRLAALVFALAVPVLWTSGRAAAAQQWLVASDLHVNPYAPNAEPIWYGADTNWALFESAVNAMRRAVPDPALVVLPGDFLAHSFGAKVHKYGHGVSTQQAAEATMRRIAQTFARAFPRAHFAVAIGNNDDPCGDYASTPNSRYMADLARIWAPLVNRGGASPQFLRTFSAGGFYTASAPGGHLRLVVLNSVFWSFVYHNACGKGNPGAAEFPWFERALAAPGDTRNVVIMHIPPGVDAKSTSTVKRFVIVPFLNDGANARFLRDVAAPANNVAFTIAAHVHRSDFRVDADVPILIASSISPIYDNTPSFVRLDVDRGRVNDVQTFAYDYDSGTWPQFFDFDRGYGASAFDGPGLLDVHRRIGDDPEIRRIWSAVLVSGSWRKRGVSSTSWRTVWCAQTRLQSGFAQCAGAQRRVAAVAVGLGIAGALLLIALIVLILRLARQRRPV